MVRALNDGDMISFVGGLRREAWMLGDTCVKFQVGLIERAVLRDRAAFITALLDLDPALLRSHVPPPSGRIGFAFTYAKTHLLPMLLRIWRLPDDLRCERREDGAVVGRGATTAGAGITLRATSRLQNLLFVFQSA
jgi:hypothetical protein